MSGTTFSGKKCLSGTVFHAIRHCSQIYTENARPRDVEAGRIKISAWGLKWCSYLVWERDKAIEPSDM